MEPLFPYPIRLVVLDYPVRHWQDPEVQSMFCKITDLKLRGYWTKHGHDSVMPVDVSDLIGANVVTCYETPDGLIPIMAFRMLTLSRCDLHRNRFPALSVLESSGQETGELEGIVSRAREASRDIVYGSSWTRAEGLPSDPEARLFLRNLHTANMMNFIESRGIHEFIACGVIRFKIDEYLTGLGMRPISSNFSQYSVFDQNVTMFHIGGIPEWTVEARSVRRSLSRYWDTRWELGSPGLGIIGSDGRERAA